MTRTDVDLCFKGDRTYLHGTDVYTCAVSLLRERWPNADGRCRFTFNRLARRPVTAWVGSAPSPAPRPQGCVAEMHVTAGVSQVSIWFVEREGEVACRYPYDEEAIVRESVITGTRIIGTRVPDHVSTIELLVAMTKRLHQVALAPPAAGGRWLFTRLDLPRLLRASDRETMSVTISAVRGAVLTRSEITVGGEPLGVIFFSAGTP
jgi:hypothetical protein